MNINVEPFLSPVTLNDIKKSLNFIPKGRSLRLVRIPVFDFSKVMDSILIKNKFIPFRPVIFNNIPVDMTDNLLPECIIVADDDTNISKTAIKETELFKG